MSARLAALDSMPTDFMAHLSQLRTPLTALQEGTALLLDNIPAPITPSQREGRPRRRLAAAASADKLGESVTRGEKGVYNSYPPPRAAEDHAPHAETQGVAEALDPGFAEGEEHPEEPPSEAPEEPGSRGSRPRWSEQRRETAWDWPSRARGPQGMEQARVVIGSYR